MMQEREYNQRWMQWRERVLDIVPRSTQSSVDKLGDLAMEAYVAGKQEGKREGAAKERERCVQIAEGHAEEYGKEYERLHARSKWSKAHVASECQTTALYIAKAIRESGKENNEQKTL